jgi:hypothetical protein
MVKQVVQEEPEEEDHPEVQQDDIVNFSELTEKEKENEWVRKQIE